jgi:hypothetical protein
MYREKGGIDEKLNFINLCGFYGFYDVLWMGHHHRQGGGSRYP